MSRAVIEARGSRVAFDGRKWTPVGGPVADRIAFVLNSMLWELGRNQYYPDSVEGIAKEAAQYLGGEIVEFESSLGPYDPEHLY